MDNPPEGHEQQTPHQWPSVNDSTNVPALEAHSVPLLPATDPPAPPAPPLSNTAPPPNIDQPHTSRASTLILQWLTYAFWGWTVLILSALTTSVFQHLIAGQDVSTFNYYAIAGLIVLFPISFACDTIYSKQEPDRKTGPSSLIMVIHAVIFALFAIGSLLFAAWSIVSLATGTGDNSSTTADLISALIIGIFYAATFMRTLNPSHISWIPRAYRLAMLGVLIVFIILGVAKPTFHKTVNSTSNSSTSGSQSYATSSSNSFYPNGNLEPAPVGGTQCDINTLSDGSSYAQVAVSGGATCGVAESVIQGASGNGGKNYASNGYSCTSIRQGAGTQWSSYWNDNFYSYSCSKGSDQVAFNWQSAAQSRSSSTITN